MSKFSEDLKVMQARGFKFNGNDIKFPVYHVDGVSVDELNLGTRAGNGLKRAKIMTIGELLDENVDLYKMRNMGVKSVKEIKNAVLNYSYDHMSDKQKEDFWKEIMI